jgi:beta-lactamase regulating signal transducer with metallopeptidase domain/thiol-disulfide isomerase/thioredoxin
MWEVLTSLPGDLSGFGLTWLLQASVLLTLGLGAGWLSRASGPALQSGIYRTTLAAVLLCPFASAALGITGFRALSIGLQPTASEALLETPSMATRRAFRLMGERAISSPADRRGQQGGHTVIPTGTPLPRATAISDGSQLAIAKKIRFVSPAEAAAAGVALWLLGSTFLGLRLWVGHCRMRTLRLSAVPAAASEQALCRELAAGMHVASPSLWRSPYLFSPCLVGLWHPAILLPDDVDKSLRETLVHELAHLRRGDGLWNLLRHLVVAAIWVHPLVWVLSRRLEATAEEVCDDYVVNSGAERVLYAGHLLELADRSLAPVAPASVGMVSLRSMLARRIIRILDTSRSVSLHTSAWAVCATLAVGAAGTAFAGLIGVAGERDAELRAAAEQDRLQPGRGERPARDGLVMPGGQSADGAIALAARSQSAKAGHPDEKPSRVIEGRVTDHSGRPVHEGKVMFGPEAVMWPWFESGVATINSEGRYHVELPANPSGPDGPPATGPLRYLAIAPDFQSAVGKVQAGSAQTAVDIRLVPKSWRMTEILLVDRNQKPVEGAELTLSLGGRFVWLRQKSDARGRCLINSPADEGFSVLIRHEGYLPTEFASRATADDPTSFTVPLYAPIEGRVVDPAGKPLAGIQIGRLIGPNYDAGLDKPSDYLMVYKLIGSKEVAATDANGCFRLAPKINLNSHSGAFEVRPMAICFADASLRQLYFLRVDLQAPREAYEITLRPGRQVRIPIEHEVSSPLEVLESWWELSAEAGPSGPDSGIFVMQGIVKRHGPSEAIGGGDWIEAVWPEGRYQLKVNSADRAAGEGAEETTTAIAISAGEGQLVLPAIRMKPFLWRRLAGKPAPEIDAKDLNTGAPVKLADYRGKVVVLDFWGSWCGPCIGSMPMLMEAHDRYRGKPVAIITVHDQSIQSRVEYDGKLSEVKRQVWNNRELPFTVALDNPDPELAPGTAATGQGSSCKRYEVTLFPTTMIIDQDGNVAGTVNVREDGKLDAMIDRLLKKRER